MISRFLSRNDFANAAPSLGLYRILFSIAYLVELYMRNTADFRNLPPASWRPLLLLARMPAPPPEVFTFLEVSLTALSILLLVGYRTRLTTFLLLILGTFYCGVRSSFIGHMEHPWLYLETYIPAVMVFSTWGDTFSLDQRAGRVSGIPYTSWRHNWPRNALLLILAVTFCSSAFMKLVHVDILTQPDFLRNALLQQYVLFSGDFLPLNTSLLLFVARTPAIYVPLRFMVIVFEGILPLMALRNDRWRNLFLAAAVGFHWYNAMVMGIIGWSPMLVTYALYVDWHSLYRRYGRAAKALAVILAALAAGYVLFVGPLYTLNVPLDWTIWYLMTPVLFYSLAKAVLGLVQPWFRHGPTESENVAAS